jgi:hypothetical protein
VLSKLIIQNVNILAHPTHDPPDHFPRADGGIDHRVLEPERIVLLEVNPRGFRVTLNLLALNRYTVRRSLNRGSTTSSRFVGRGVSGVLTTSGGFDAQFVSGSGFDAGSGFGVTGGGFDAEFNATKFAPFTSMQLMHGFNLPAAETLLGSRRLRGIAAIGAFSFGGRSIWSWRLLRIGPEEPRRDEVAWEEGIHEKIIFGRLIYCFHIINIKLLILMNPIDTY